MKVKSLSRVWLFATPWTNQIQPMEFSRPDLGVGSLSLLQGIFSTQGSNPGLPQCGWILYRLRHKGSPRILEWVAYPFSSGSSRPRNPTGVSCTARGFFTNWVIREALTICLIYSLTFFATALLWDWNENWPFPVLWPLLSFPNLLTYLVQHFNSNGLPLWLSW